MSSRLRRRIDNFDQIEPVGRRRRSAGTAVARSERVGHMLDAPSRPKDKARFPATPEAEAEARRMIKEAVQKELNEPGGVTLGIAGGACGGDILFHETCRELGIRTTVVLPFAPNEFLRTSVEGADGGNWPQRFTRIWETTPPGERYMLNLPISDAAYTECNDRMLDLARTHGAVQLIAVWDGGAGDGPGGTAHFLACAKQVSGREPDVIDPKSFLSKD